MESERAFQDKVIAMAIMYGWKVHHVRPGMNSKGRWMTHVQGHIGFPDLVLAHASHGIIYAELKSDTGRATVEQLNWLQVLNEAGAECYVWRPADFHYIVKRLGGQC
jgi:hypothetical protein